MHQPSIHHSEFSDPHSTSFKLQFDFSYVLLKKYLICKEIELVLIELHLFLNVAAIEFDSFNFSTRLLRNVIYHVRF